MIHRKLSESKPLEYPSEDVGSAPVPESPKTTIRMDEGLKADVERCAAERGIKVAEFMRQAAVHYVAWIAAEREAHNDDSPQHEAGG